MKKSSFEFFTPELISLNFHMNDRFDDPDQITSNISTKTDVKIHKELPKAYVQLTISSDESNNFPFCFDVTMGVEVHWEADCESQMINSVLKNNVPAMLLSYIRPIISILTSNSGYPAFNIPFLDFRNSDKEN